MNATYPHTPSLDTIFVDVSMPSALSCLHVANAEIATKIDKATGPVLVMGEALIDLIAASNGSLVPKLGGGSFNTALGMARLGAPCAFLGSLSTDPYGVRLREALIAEGVSVLAGLETDRPTSLSMAAVDAAGKANYRFYFEGTSAPRVEPDRALAALEAMQCPPCALHIGGLGLVLEPVAAAVEDVVVALAGSALIMVDPNLRQPLAEYSDAFGARLLRVLAKADVVKVSDDDLRAMDPTIPPLQSARNLLRHGPRLVLLTLGERGAIAMGSFGERVFSAPSVAVVDTIGAGDTFSAAWLACWLAMAGDLSDEDVVARATEFGCEAAAVSCTHAGASPPRLADL